MANLSENQFIDEVLELSNEYKFNNAELSNIFVNLIAWLMPEQFDEEDVRTYIHNAHTLTVRILKDRKEIIKRIRND